MPLGPGAYQDDIVGAKLLARTPQGLLDGFGGYPVRFEGFLLMRVVADGHKVGEVENHRLAVEALEIDLRNSLPSGLK